MNAPESLNPGRLALAETHEVHNVGSELLDYDMYRQDAALVEAVQREGAGWADAALGEFGRLAAAALAEPGDRARPRRCWTRTTVSAAASTW